MISPLILADDDDPKSLLAGEFMGDFGGFLSEELRASDFSLGYRGGAQPGSSAAFRNASFPTRRRTGRSRQSARRRRPSEAGKRGEAEAGDLSIRDRMQIVRLAAHTARVAGSGWLDLRSRIPDPIGKLLRRRE